MRRIINSNFRGQLDLLPRLDAYHTSLGAGNYLDAMFTLEGIVWADIVAAGPLALAKDILAKDYAASGHTDIEKRDTKSTDPISHMKGGGQNLKSQNPSNKTWISVFGFPVLSTGRIKYTGKWSDMYLNWQTYFAKDASYGIGLSPLQTYNTTNNYNMANDNTAMIAADASNTSAITNEGLAAENTDLRNTIWAPPIVAITKIYNLIKSTNRTVQRTLGLAGFPIAGNAPGHKNQNSKALQMSHVLVHGAIIGSVAYNNNAFDGWYIKGKDPLGTRIPFPKNSAIAITKGMSSFILGNDNTLLIAKYVVTVRK